MTTPSSSSRKRYPSDVSNDEWAVVAPCLTLMKEDAPQRDHASREGVNGPRWVVRTGAEERMLLRAITGREPQRRAMALDSRTLNSTPERGERAGSAGAKRRKGTTVPLAVDTLGTPTTAQDRAQVAPLAKPGRQATSETVAVAVVDQGYTGEPPAEDIRLAVVTRIEAKCGFVLLPRRWVVERSNAWLARFRWLARDDERLAETLAGFLFLACAIGLLARFIALMTDLTLAQSVNWRGGR